MSSWMKDAFGSDSSGSDSEGSDSEVDAAVPAPRPIARKKKRPAESDVAEEETTRSAEEEAVKKKKKKRRLQKGGEERSENNDDDDDDDGFIDRTGDDEDIVKEYNAQREYESDEDPYGDEEKDYAARNPFVADVEEDDDDDADAAPLDRAMKRLRKKKGRNRKKKVDDKTKRYFAEAFVEKIVTAAQADAASVRLGEPGLAKLKMLKEAIGVLQQREMHFDLLKAGVLLGLHEWIRPLPNGSLPNLKIRSAIINILQSFDVSMDHLKKSGLGRVCAFLRDHKSETKDNKEKLNSIIQEWSRIIFRNSRDYSSIHKKKQQENQQEREKQLPRKAPPAAQRPKGVSALSRAAKEDDGQIRARIPQPRSFNFTKAPQMDKPLLNLTGGANDDKNSKRNQLKQRMQSMRKSGKGAKRAVKMSIEGRR